MLHRATADWLFSDDVSSITSFRAICDLLDIDAHGVRLELARWAPLGGSRSAEIATPGSGARRVNRPLPDQAIWLVFPW